MPRNFVKIFGIIWLCGVSMLWGATPAQDSLLAQGDYYFDYERYPEAIQSYEKVVALGLKQERLWYRLAFLYEQTEQPAQAIYFLRKIQYTFGGERLDAKIEQLMGQANPSRFSSGERWTDFQQWLYRHRGGLSLMGLMVAVLALVLVYVNQRRKKNNYIGVVLAALALLTSVVQIRQMWISPQTHGVVVSPTSLYEAPSYAATGRQFPIGLGATVEILQRTDIWVEVRMEQFSAWIPAQTLREV